MKLYNVKDLNNNKHTFQRKFAWKLIRLINDDVVWLEYYLYTITGTWKYSIPYDKRYINLTYDEYLLEYIKNKG